MDIGKINEKVNNYNVSTTKEQVANDDFEKRLRSAYEKQDEKELKKVCKDFEGIFINMMYKQMRATVPKSELISGDVGKDVFESMMDDKLMEKASEGRGIGLADVLYNQLSRQLKSAYKPSNGGNTEVGGNG
ncbi:MAG: rod-binding protein [Clostridia bacterium]|nr:rod-binding protein [Clostridia bacterium]